MDSNYIEGAIRNKSAKESETQNKRKRRLFCIINFSFLSPPPPFLSAPPPPPPQAASPAPVEKGKKGAPKRRPKLEATTKQDRGVAPFSD